jgi:hypothetical protein
MEDEMAEITRKLHDWIREVLEYNPYTGEFLWVTTGHGHRTGDIAGSIYASGHRYIQIEGLDYRAARLAWFFVTGEDPRVFVDHRNGDRADDRFDNLRLATNSQNQANAWWTTNTSGFKGVSWQRSRGQWAASITVDGKAKFLGRFNTRIEAARAYQRAAIEAWGEFANVPSEEEMEALDEHLTEIQGRS